MENRYYKAYSNALGREMECKIYGHGGRPFLFVPCQDGRFFDFEDFHMVDVFAPWIESGEVMVFAIDTLDKETWSAQGDAYWRVRRHEQWMHYIVGEMVPFIRGISGRSDIVAFGCSLGATHAVNLFYRFPDHFNGLLALSGIYHAGYGFGDYMDELVYNNSPVDFLNNMPWDHPYIGMYNERKILICVGQGAWEDVLLESTRRLDEVMYRKGIHARFAYWGHDVNHDWPWWYKMVACYAPDFL